MEVELDHSLLAGARDDLTLLGICALGSAGRHRVVPSEDAAWGVWAKSFGDTLREELETVWELGRQGLAIGRAARSLVVSTHRNLSTNALRLLPAEALALLARPMRVLLENGRNDRAFLLAFASSDLRRTLEDAEKEGWLEFETAGGIGELKVRLEDAPQTSGLQLLRSMFVCDSDTKKVGTRSQEAGAVFNALRVIEKRFSARTGYFGSVLTRRAAENYAPPSRICSWAQKQIKDAHTVFEQWTASRADVPRHVSAAGSPQRRLYAAIASRELGADLLAVIDMKHGASGTDPDVWAKLDPVQQAALRDGFGAGFAAEFYADQEELPDDTGDIAAILNTLRERL